MNVVAPGLAGRSRFELADDGEHILAAQVLGQPFVFYHGQLEGLAAEAGIQICVQGASHALNHKQVSLIGGDGVAQLLGESAHIQAGTSLSICIDQ